MAKKEVKKDVKPNIKAQILQAAEEEFLTEGYAGARTTNIAKRAGVTHAMLHYYFQSKVNLFEMVFRQKAGMFFGSFATIMEQPLPFTEKIAHLIETHLELLKVYPRIPMFLIGEATKNPDLLKASIVQDAENNPFVKFRKLFEKEVRKAVQQQIIRPIEPIEVLLMIFSLNIFPVLAQPILLAAGIVPEKRYRKMMARRSQHVTAFVMNAIKKI
jgi:AcrR family transcriptional regulator